MRVPKCVLTRISILVILIYICSVTATTIKVCHGGTRTVALDDLDWGNEPMLHRLRLKYIDKFASSVLRVEGNPGDTKFKITAGTTPRVSVSVMAQIIESGKVLNTTMIVEVQPAAQDGEVCIQLSGEIFCDGSPRNNQRDQGEVGFNNLEVIVSTTTVAGTLHDKQMLRTNSQGQWYNIGYFPPGEWKHTATYIYNDQSTTVVEKVQTSPTVDYIVLDGVPVPSLGVCEITRFSTLLIVANDCRCRIVDIKGALTADVDAAPIVIDRPLTFIGIDGASLDATAFPAGIPIFVTEGVHAEFGMKTLDIKTSNNPAIMLGSGQAHQIVATTFTFQTAPTIVITTVIPRIEISWCIFDITQSTHTLTSPAYAVDNTIGLWGENSVLLRNSIHTPTCLDEKLFLTQKPTAGDYDGSGDIGHVDILFTHTTCGDDNTVSDPCVYGISNARSGECECEYGCSGDLCSDDNIPERPTVYVCYYSQKLSKKVPLQLDIDKAEMLMRHAEEEKNPVHVLRDECSEVKYVPKGLCSKYAPDVDYRCNCGAPGNLNHTVSTSDLQQVLSEITDVVLEARRTEVKNYAEDNEAYRNGFWLNATFMPVLIIIVVGYLISQVEEWSYQHKIESAYATENTE